MLKRSEDIGEEMKQRAMGDEGREVEGGRCARFGGQVVDDPVC